MLREANGIGLRSFLLAGVDPKDWVEQEEFYKKWGNQFDIALSAGLHPKFVSEEDSEACDSALILLENILVSNPKRIVGEIGLDFRTEFLKLKDREHQKHYLRTQIKLAKAYQRPCIFHFVRCHEDAIVILREESIGCAQMIHSFNSSVDVAKKYLDLGCFLSIGSGILHSNNKALIEAVRAIPIDRLLVESDTPDQPPPHLRGNWNRPATVRGIVERIGEIKGLPLEATRLSLSLNFQLFLSRD